MNKADRDKFIEEIDRKLGSYEGLKGDLYKESLGEQFALAKRFYESLLGTDGIPDSQLFEEIAMSMDADVMGWVMELPFALADRASMVDEAVEIGNLFSAVHSPDNFFGDMAAILAEAGRREEAFERIKKNLQLFPDDAWIIIKAGQAYQTLKETDKAIELYNRAYGMTSRPVRSSAENYVAFFWGEIFGHIVVFVISSNSRYRQSRPRPAQILEQFHVLFIYVNHFGIKWTTP